MYTQYKPSLFLLAALVFAFVNCERSLEDDLPLATFATTAEVFTDTPIGMGSDFYFPYAGSKATAWSVDGDVSYDGSAAMRVDVPNASDPDGNYAGAIFRIDGAGRDLSQYDALTFWAKASQGVSIGEFGFGEDFGENKYLVSLQNVDLSTAWQKIIIPLPDASKLVEERGMFRYAAGTAQTNGLAYSFWIDELKFEKLGDIAHPRPKIMNGEEVTFQTFTGGSTSVSGLSQTFNLGNGRDISMQIAPAYFEFSSSANTVATVNGNGLVNVIGEGNAQITASLNGVAATGVLNIETLGDFTAAPTPMHPAANVISIFSDAYTNVPVDFFNGYWQPYQTTESATITINNDNILDYTSFNFVGNQFNTPSINASDMAFIHFDVFVPAGTLSPQLKITLKDFGNDNADGGDDDTLLEQTFGPSQLVAGQWNSLEMSLSSFTPKNRFAQIIYENLGSPLSAFYLDNVYLYKQDTAPSTAAPTPSQPAADVISIFSDTYTNITGVNYNPNWGQATQVTQENIQGNNTLLYQGLNYQGTDFGSNPQDVSTASFLHVDYYTANSSALNVYLISPGPQEKAFALTVPTAGTWASVDIPLTHFATDVDLTEIFQLKFDGNGDIYLDNIYFY